MSEDTKILEDIGQYKYGFHDRDDNYTFKSQKGLNREVVENISRMKGEPEWMLEFRLKALEHFQKRPMPNWGPTLKDLNFDEIYFYVKPTEKSEKSWDDVPDDIKRTFDKLGVPEAERKFLAGLGAQYESEMVYHSIQEHLEKQGVIFLSIEDGLKKYPDLFREYFGTVIPIEDNKFAALNSAVWSGGSFVYVPKNVKVDLPLQAYFRLNTANLGQFERTLIIVDEGASVHYVEGCTAPQYTTDSFHSGVIEIIVKKGARSRYSTIQNWSTNVYNLVTQRAKVFENASHEWVDANIGSKVTMKYPSCYLMEPGARGEMLSMAFAGPGQTQDAGGKMYHFAPNTTSKVTSKSISKGGGRTSFRGLLKVYKGAKGVKSNTVCDALLLDPQSRSDTYPYIEIDEDDVTIGHEASVSKVGEEQLFYLQQRGISQEDAVSLIINGFCKEVFRELPMEYAVEAQKLLGLKLEGSVG